MLLNVYTNLVYFSNINKKYENDINYLINDTKTLWEVVCDIIDIDYDDDNIGEIFDEILKEK